MPEAQLRRTFCKDCDAEGVERTAKSRPAPHPGPRCATHHREHKKQTSVRNHERRVQAVYGLDPGEYAERLAAQGGLCFICQKPSKIRRLAVDHDHADGRVRKLLCRNCNYDLIGKHDAATLRRAADYLENE